MNNLKAKNVLILSSAYPSDDLNNQTPVVHYFAKEWVKIGYNVKVIHNLVVFPGIYYKIASFMSEWISSKVGFKINLKKISETKDYELDNVNISRLPIFKFIPHGRYSKNRIEKQIEKIKYINAKCGFIPDIIIGHWTNPQLEILYKLKEIYNTTTCLVLHNKGEDLQRIYRKDYKQLLQGMDFIGFRSKPIKEKFEKNFGEFKKSFICNSGIPEAFFEDFQENKIGKYLKNFIFAGALLERKNPAILIPAILSNYPDKDFSITYIGIGREEKKIKTLTTTYGLKSQIKTLGYVTRTEIKKLMQESDCFIMVSKNEAFGLVYLEAMAMGCITIASRDEGIDGIIEHGINGFLCESGNIDELSKLIGYINNLSIKEKRQISYNAIKTAKKFTDYDVAVSYINAVNGSK